MIRTKCNGSGPPYLDSIQNDCGPMGELGRLRHGCAATVRPRPSAYGHDVTSAGSACNGVKGPCGQRNTFTK